MKNSLKKIVKKIIYPKTHSSDAFVNYLRKLGGIDTVGEYTYFFSPNNTTIDKKRINYLKIGSYCKISSGVKFICHDYSWSVLRKYKNEIIPNRGYKIAIGDNVFIGMNSMILGEVTIGSNVIIGAYSVVTHDIPDNVVCAGNPARVICSLEEFYKRKKVQLRNNVEKEAKYLYNTNDRYPTINEMGWLAITFLERTKQNEILLRKLPFKGDCMDEVITSFYESEPIWSSYDEFIKNVFEEIV